MGQRGSEYQLKDQINRIGEDLLEKLTDFRTPHD